MTYKSDLGTYGEDKACEYLKNKGYKIIERNYRQKWGELDIVAISPEGILTFVEVKTMRQFGNGAEELLPEEQMTAAKMKKFKKTSTLYAQNNEELINDKGWKCDLVTLTISEKDDTIRHYENI
ncbi:hypothetical protein A3A20_02785 [Candidatus Wolfebacteria bacterium RIFCSPLOWO2_01_FULL_45_19]|uniref:UPF0102 protein A3A20_02785 n=1 Tax=Candidatus Wolfebacteria bacterium RIFCSPLOWO2_01_FULL_45_19 TaxID=1802557 RepID=A0A1F8DSN6_9BACT|nr:MAG: hypothetical protein A3A20_02785 [Candidatus Wolfebacteria bacterium RIFCSPLOWO2_01_FULL_45_19]